MSGQFLLSHVQESKALHADLEEQCKAEVAPRDKLDAKIERLEVDFVSAVPFLLGEFFKVPITCLTRLVHWRTSSNKQKRHPYKDSLNRCKLLLQRTCCSAVFTTCMNTTDVHRI